MTIKISIGSDHGGYELKKALTNWLILKSIPVNDFGTNSGESVDYPPYAQQVVNSVLINQCNFGILVCGSGQGMAITANKYDEIRAALCWDKAIAALARQHNNANILVLPGRFISIDQAIEITEAFLSTEFEGGRHQKRIDLIIKYAQNKSTIFSKEMYIKNRTIKQCKQLVKKAKLISRIKNSRSGLQRVLKQQQGFFF